MSDVRIMNKIIIQIYSNLQVLWISKVKFVSLSQLFRRPSLGPTLVFSQFQVLLSHLWELKGKKKMKKEGRRDIKGKKEGIEQERRKERKKVLKEKIIKINNNNYLKKKKPPAVFKLAKPVLLVFLAAANSGDLAQLFSFPDQHSGNLLPRSPAAPRPTGSGTHPPQDYGCGQGLSLIHI